MSSSIEDEDAEFGARTLRAQLEGEVALVYEAVVDNGIAEGPAAGHGPARLERPAGRGADLSVAQPLLPVGPVRPVRRAGVRRDHGGGERVLAILNWITDNIDYEHGVSDSETTAARTFIDRAGVCRDFTHLGITLCRASGIPARAVSAYAHQLSPPDFHAIFEIWLSNGWWLVDPTGLAPIEGLVRIACGRDAADIAFLTHPGDLRDGAPVDHGRGGLTISFGSGTPSRPR